MWLYHRFALSLGDANRLRRRAFEEPPHVGHIELGQRHDRLQAAQYASGSSGASSGASADDLLGHPAALEPELLGPDKIFA
ncbi:hypothetical protein B586_18625 [Mycobacterium haemophilum DSM 44634]|nr:hypothetical protein B586_18625 [Mycobacterium haemophilum DSM 44634]